MLHKSPSTVSRSPDAATLSSASHESGIEARLKWLGPLIVLLTPTILIVSNDGWLFPFGNPTDAWLNVSYFIDYGSDSNPYVKNSSSLAIVYKSTRLSWILKGALFHRVLPLPVSYYALHISMLLLCSITFYFVAAMMFSRLSATIAAVLFSTYSHFHSIVSFEWDYHSHDAALNLLLGMLFILLASRGKRWKLWLALAGVAISSALQSPYNINYIIPIAILYLYANYNNNKIGIWKSLLYLSLGGAVSTIFYSLVSWYSGGPIFFYEPQIRMSLMWGGQGRYQASYWVPIVDALTKSKGLVVPLYIAILTFLTFMFIIIMNFRTITRGLRRCRGIERFRSWNYSDIICICYLISFATHVVLHMLGHPFLYDDHFIVAIAPFSFLAFGAVLQILLPKGSVDRKYASYAVIMIVLICVLPLVFGLNIRNISNFGPDFLRSVDIYFPSNWLLKTTVAPIPNALILFFIFVGLLFVVPAKRLLLAAFLVAILSNANIMTTSIPIGLYDFRNKCRLLPHQYMSVMEARHFIGEYDQRYDPVVLWYQINENLSDRGAHCPPDRTIKTVGHTEFSLSALYGALYGARIFMADYRLVDVDRLAAIWDEHKKGAPQDLQKWLPKDVTHGIGVLHQQGVLGKYMRTESFSKFTYGKFWSETWRDDFRVAVLAQKSLDIRASMSKLEQLGFVVSPLAQKKIESGAIVFYVQILDVSRRGK